MYNVESLKSGITQCKNHIKELEQAIEREKKTMKDYRSMIKDIDKQKKIHDNMEVNVEIVRE